jgi:hypothetical protein
VQTDTDRYNSVFYSYARGITGDPTGAWINNIAMWPGVDEFTLTFANGSTKTLETVAKWGKNSFNYTSGEAVSEAFCLPKTSPSLSSRDAGSSEPKIAPPYQNGPRGYPVPKARDPYDLISGYYLEGQGLDDVAVLLIPTFEVTGGASAARGVLPQNATAVFSQVAIDFQSANKDGKTRIIVDVSGNGGGDIVAGFNLFRLFFPDQDVYTATRYRTHEMADLVTQAFSNAYAIAPESVSGAAIVWQQQVSPDQKNDFASLDDFYGPYEAMGTNVTNLFANFNFTLQSVEENPVSGYGQVPLNPTTQLFKPENIIIVSLSLMII